MEDLIVYYYNKKTGTKDKIKLKDLLIDLEKSSQYPFSSGFKFFLSEGEQREYQTKYEKWENNL